MYDENNEPSESLVNDWNIHNDHAELVEYDEEHLTECPMYEGDPYNLGCSCMTYHPEWTM